MPFTIDGHLYEIHKRSLIAAWYYHAFIFKDAQMKFFQVKGEWLKTFKYHNLPQMVTNQNIHKSYKTWKLAIEEETFC